MFARTDNRINQVSVLATWTEERRYFHIFIPGHSNQRRLLFSFQSSWHAIAGIGRAVINRESLFDIAASFSRAKPEET
jgi:hypothetical protein